MKVTIKQLEKWGSCYTKEEHIAVFGKRRAFTFLEIAKLEHVPIRDRIWVLMRHDDAQYWACDFAEHVLHIYEDSCPNDSRPRDCIETTRKYLKGEATLGQLQRSRGAATAACTAATDAAYAAYTAADAHAAANANAAATAACTAATDAAYAAYTAADAYAAAEREWQLNHIIKSLEEE